MAIKSTRFKLQFGHLLGYDNGQGAEDIGLSFSFGKIFRDVLPLRVADWDDVQST